ncbi:MAG: hypothetical protein LBR79_02550 [Oscillospiraceae bacterium]|nr:hypothetical protein [Oscillospiraceae bacterium]
MSEEKTEEISKLDDIESVFKIYKSFDDNLSKENFIKYVYESADIVENFKNQTNEVKVEMLNKVSGGKMNKNFNKTIASLLGVITLATVPISVGASNTDKSSPSTTTNQNGTLKKVAKGVGYTIAGTGALILTAFGLKKGYDVITENDAQKLLKRKIQPANSS